MRIDPGWFFIPGMAASVIYKTAREIRAERPKGPMREVEGNIIGWRAFNANYGHLTSPIHSHHQFDLIGVNRIQGREQPTERLSTTGFYCFRYKTSCVKYFHSGPGSAYARVNRLVFGTVLCHGYVMHHTRLGWFDTSPEGFRAEKIEILSLYATYGPHNREIIAQDLGWLEPIKHIDEGPEKFPLHLKEINRGEIRQEDETPPRDPGA